MIACHRGKAVTVDDVPADMDAAEWLLPPLRVQGHRRVRRQGGHGRRRSHESAARPLDATTLVGDISGFLEPSASRHYRLLARFGDRQPLNSSTVRRYGHNPLRCLPGSHYMTANDASGNGLAFLPRTGPFSDASCRWKCRLIGKGIMSLKAVIFVS